MAPVTGVGTLCAATEGPSQATGTTLKDVLVHVSSTKTNKVKLKLMMYMFMGLYTS